MLNGQTKQQASEEMTVVGKPKLIAYVNDMIIDALRLGATAIHIEPLAHSVQIRYQIGGGWHELDEPPADIRQGIAPRVKTMVGIDAAQGCDSQEGNIPLRIAGEGNRNIGLHVSCSPSQWDEEIVIMIRQHSSTEECSFSPSESSL